MANKKYTLPAPEQIVSAAALRLVQVLVLGDTGEAHVTCEWLDAGGSPLQTEVFGLDVSETDDLLSGYNPAGGTFEERVLSWLSSNGKVTGGGSVEDLS